LKEEILKNLYSLLIALLLAPCAFGDAMVLDAPIKIDPAKLAAAHAALRTPAISRRWSVFASVGVSGAGTTRYSFAGVSAQNTADTMSTGLSAGGGVSYLINPIFQLAGEFEYSSYKYSAGTAGDSELLLMFVPRAQNKTGKQTVWVGLGTGFAITTLANSPTALSTGVAFPSSAMGIVLSPEVGCDYDVGKFSFIGAQLSYAYTTGSVGIPGSGPIPTSENYSRRWASLALRYGTRF